VNVSKEIRQQHLSSSFYGDNTLNRRVSPTGGDYGKPTKYQDSQDMIRVSVEGLPSNVKSA